MKETLEKAAKIYTESTSDNDPIRIKSFIEGARWMEKQMYSEEKVIDLIQFLSMNQEINGYGSVSKETAKYFLEKYKKQ